MQYEISNFARPVTHGMGLRESRHNLKYWTRQPYLGFGVDAHSMLPANPELQARGIDAVRFATPDSLEAYSQPGGQLDPDLARLQQLRQSRTLVDAQAALEESFFLGLRVNRGVSLQQLQHQFGENALREHRRTVEELGEAGLLNQDAECLRLTARGRLLSNEVFARFLKAAHCGTTPA